MWRSNWPTRYSYPSDWIARRLIINTISLCILVVPDFQRRKSILQARRSQPLELSICGLCLVIPSKDQEAMGNVRVGGIVKTIFTQRRKVHAIKTGEERIIQYRVA